MTLKRYSAEHGRARLNQRKQSSHCDKNDRMALSPGHPLSGERVRRIPPLPTIKNQGNTEKIKIYDNIVRIATWNVRSLFMPGKLNTEAEMNRINIDILGLSEVRWPGSGRQRTSNGYIYHSGGTDPEHRYGTAILVSDRVAQSVIDFVPLGDRVALLKLQTTHRDLNIIQVYAPTTTNDKPDQEIEEFYNKIDEVMRLTTKGEITMIIRDFNAKIGRGVEGDSIGAYGLGERNAPQKTVHLEVTSDREKKIVRNQIDFILLGLSFKRYMKSTRTYPGADIGSDHNPVVLDFRLKRFLRKEISSKTEKELEMVEVPVREEDVEKTWNDLRTRITNIQEKDIGFTATNKKQEWMTQEILTSWMTDGSRRQTR
ncbi:craniofacial development protein 2-like [Sitophilus oryzae]|uniref:Craniofacial development protein 2-like n=1 Tax=Sitophilus oryzae TaxID=7048 RepID=A0A6J2X4B5_SITOR|nr:craniofacial development protein 2-like [Sitophilus oryzae]